MIIIIIINETEIDYLITGFALISSKYRNDQKGRNLKNSRPTGVNNLQKARLFALSICLYDQNHPLCR